MTDRYPRGKLRHDDEGEIDLAITVQDRTIIIAFPEPTTWIGMSKDQALGLAQLIILRANEIK